MATIFDIRTQICPDIGIFRLSGVRLSDVDCMFKTVHLLVTIQKPETTSIAEHPKSATLDPKYVQLSNVSGYQVFSFQMLTVLC
jgi:hypothetical protein